MEKSNILLALEQSQVKQSIVSIYPDINYPEKCSVGFIERISDEHIIMKHISRNGFYDGYIIRRLENIFRVDYDGKYERKILTLYNVQNQKHDNLLNIIIDEETDILKESLLCAMNKGLVVSIFVDDTLNEEYFYGLICSVDNDELVVSRLTSDGEDDGISIIKIDEIIAMNCDTDDEILIRLLHMNRNV